MRISPDKGNPEEVPERGPASTRVIRLALFLIWLLTFLLYSYTAFTVPGRSSFLSPDENNTYNVARSLREDGTAFLDSPLNERFGLKIFRGRLYVEVEENRYTAFNSLGLSCLVSLGMYLGVPFFVVPLIASLGVLGIYLLVKELSDYRAGLLAAFLWGLLPTNLFFSNLLMDAIPAFSLLLLCLGTMLTALRNRSGFAAACSGIALGMSFFIRYAVIVYVAIILAYLAWNWKRFKPRLLLCICIPSAAIALAIMAMNRSIYGKFITGGQLEGAGKAASRTLIPGFSLSSVLHALSTYVVEYMPLLILLGVAGFFLAARKDRHKPMLSFHFAMLAFVAITVMWFGSRAGTWSFSHFSISGSMARYFTPIYFVLTIYSSIALVRLARQGKRFLSALLIAAIVCSFCAFAFGSLEYTDVPYLKKRFAAYSARKADLLESGQPTVVFTKYQDKDLYDDVEVGLCFTAADLAGNQDLVFFPIIDPEKDILPVVDQLLSEDWRVLVGRDAVELQEALLARGYVLEKCKEYPGLFKVSRGE